MVAVGFWVPGDDVGTLPSDSGGSRTSADEPARDPSRAAAGAVDDAPRAVLVGAQKPEDQGSRIDSNTVFGVVELRAAVAHDGGSAPAESFRWRAVGTAMGIEPQGVSEGRVARIRVPVDVDAAVVVEVDGCKPSLPVDVALHGTRFRAVEARLLRRYETVRVTLRCRDEFGSAVRRVTVRCERQPQDAESRREWRTLWTRDSAATDGVHVLELPAGGWCRFHVTPIEEHRLPRRLLSEVREVRIAEDRRVDQEIVHAVGGTVVLAWDDRGTAPRGLAGASVRLFDALGRQVAVNWNKGEPSSVGFAIDQHALPCHTEQALPEGSYTVRVQGEALDVARRIEVRKAQETRVVLP